MSYNVYAIPVSRPVTDPMDFNVPGVVRLLTVDEARLELTPVLPSYVQWSPGQATVTARAPGRTESFDIAYSDAQKCLILGGSFGWKDTEADAAIRRIAALPGWKVFDPQAYRFILP